MRCANLNLKLLKYKEWPRTIIVVAQDQNAPVAKIRDDMQHLYFVLSKKEERRRIEG